MGPVKRVLLGSAAGVFAVAGAQAADLAVKAKPVEYVKVCSLYGAGFWYVPGTDTCIKIGAFVKLQAGYNLNQGGPFMMGVASNGTGNTGGRHDRTDSSPFTFNKRWQHAWVRAVCRLHGGPHAVVLRPLLPGNLWVPGSADEQRHFGQRHH